LKPQNSHGPLPTLPFRVVHFPLFAPPGHTNKHEHKSLLNISKITFKCIKEVLHASETCHLSIAHLVDTHKYI
jgi:hypothetical protein